MKLTASKTDESMYLLKKGNKLHGIVCVVVDDLCMVGDDLAMKEFEKLKTDWFSYLTTEEVSWFRVRLLFPRVLLTTRWLGHG